MAEDKQYQPINCEIHDGFELACIRKATHNVTWLEDGHEFTDKLRFLDLTCTKGCEYLIAENEEQDQVKIRLDNITSSLPY